MNYKFFIFLIHLLFDIVLVLLILAFNSSPTSYFDYFLIFILLSMYIYIKIYTWRRIDLTISSFIFFSINFLILILYLLAIKTLFQVWHGNLWHPVYLDDISVISQYRYLIFACLAIAFISIYILNRFMGYKIDTTWLTYPYLKQELLTIFKFQSLYDFHYHTFVFLYTSKYQIKHFFLISFIVMYIVPLCSTCLLTYCVFFHGNFQYFLIISPLMFIIWLLSFYYYSFKHVNKISILYWLTIVTVTIPENMTLEEASTKEFNFKLKEEAILRGYDNEYGYQYIANQWYTIMLPKYYHDYYLEKPKDRISKLRLIIQVIIWIYLTIYFFIPY